MAPRRLQLVWSIKEEPAAVLRVAFASTDRSRVNQHFGAAEGFAGGVGAQATLVHVNKMGSSFRLTRLVYALDGTQIFSRSEETSPNLYKSKSFDILTGPILID